MSLRRRLELACCALGFAACQQPPAAGAASSQAPPTEAADAGAVQLGSSTHETAEGLPLDAAVAARDARGMRDAATPASQASGAEQRRAEPACQSCADAASPSAARMPSTTNGLSRATDDADAGPALDAGAHLPGSLRVLQTTYLGQLTGRKPNPLDELGMMGTDLGISFPYDSSLYFLFGDTASLDLRNANLDSLAKSRIDPRPGDVPKLTWLTRPSGQFLPLRLPGVDLGFMNVGVEGLTIAGVAYLFFAAGWSDDEQRHSSSLLAHAPGGDFANLQIDHRVTTQRFISVSAIAEEHEVWIWGAGNYRHSAIYLARAPLASFADRSSWTYYAGHAQAFVSDEALATPLIDVACVGELSARKHPTLGIYMLAYNCESEQGHAELLHTAQHPTGPWSAPLKLFESSDGYEHFMHVARSQVQYDDGLGELGQEDVSGAEYGPYLIPQWFSEPAPGAHAIVYTLSSWNPYQVQLMRSVLVEPGSSYRPPQPGAGLPRAKLVNADFADGALTGWQAEGDPFRAEQAADGTWLLSTLTRAGSAARGTLWQEFTIDANTSELRFEIYAGSAPIVLYSAGAAVRTTRKTTLDAEPLRAVWNLTTLRGETVRLSIEDQASDALGYVRVGGFRLD